MLRLAVTPGEYCPTSVITCRHVLASVVMLVLTSASCSQVEPESSDCFYRTKWTFVSKGDRLPGRALFVQLNPGIEEDQLAGEVEGISNIKGILLEKSTIGERDIHCLLSHPEIEMLKMVECTVENKAKFLQLCGGLPNLSSIALVKMEWVDDETIEGIVAAAGSRLRCISLSGTALGDRGMVHVVKCPRLKYLNIDFTKVSDRSVGYILRARGLQELSIILPEEQMPLSSLQRVRNELSSTTLVTRDVN